MSDIEFNCNKCGQHITIDEAGAGLVVHCPKCRSSLTVPRKKSQPVASPSISESEPAGARMNYILRKPNGDEITKTLDDLAVRLENGAVKPDWLARREDSADWIALADLIASDAPNMVLNLQCPVICTTGNDIAGHTVAAYLGVVRGIVVRAPNIAQGLMGGLKSIVGGNIESFAKVCEAARHEAYDRMMQSADKLGADAVLSMRYDATEFSQGITEVLAYGTAVKLVAADSSAEFIAGRQTVKGDRPTHDCATGQQTA